MLHLLAKVVKKNIAWLKRLLCTLFAYKKMDFDILHNTAKSTAHISQDLHHHCCHSDNFLSLKDLHKYFSFCCFFPLPEAR